MWQVIILECFQCILDGVVIDTFEVPVKGLELFEVSTVIYIQ